MEENLILNQHWAKSKTTFSTFTQHSVLTSHPSKRVGMAGLRDSKPGTTKTLLKQKNRIPCLLRPTPFTPGTGCQLKPKQISFILVQPQGVRALYSSKDFQSFPIPYFHPRHTLPPILLFPQRTESPQTLSEGWGAADEEFMLHSLSR